MKQNFVAAAVVIIVAGTAVYGCGNQQASAPATTQAAPVEPPPGPPPPTIAAQQEIELVAMGAHLAQDGLYVTLGASEFGGKKQDEFMPKSPDLLDRVSRLLKERGELHLVVTGYTDSRGRKAANEALSMQRASSVRDYLASHEHLDATRVEVKGMGDADPVASNDSEAGRAQNQRVVLRIVDAAGNYASRAAMGVQGAAPVVQEAADASKGR